MPERGRRASPGVAIRDKPHALPNRPRLSLPNSRVASDVIHVAPTPGHGLDDFSCRRLIADTNTFLLRQTTILYRLQIGEVVSTIPSEANLLRCQSCGLLLVLTKRPPPAFSTRFVAIGFNVETVTYKNINFQVWDLGGQSSIR